MPDPEQRSSKDVLQQFDESIFKPKLENRVQLPTDEGMVFEEVQPFDQLWIWILLGVEFLVMMIIFLATGIPWWTIAMILGFMSTTTALMGSLKLYTRIDSEGIHYRMTPFHFKEKAIYWGEVDQIHVRKYSPIKEYGGWGIRYGGKNGRAFNVRGDVGIQIVKKDGKRILLGTQKPDEVSRQLAGHPLLV